MRVEFLIENVENLLPTLTKILPTHSQIPVLSNLLLEATKDGFFIYATNLELGIKMKIPAKIEEEGATTIPGKQFIEALSSFPKDKVGISLDKDTLNVVCRDNKVSFRTIAREEFPSLYDQKGEKIHTFAAGEMKDIFSKLIFAVSGDESRPELTGVLLSQKEKFIDFAATDGFRLSLKRLDEKRILDTVDTMILPARLISEAALIHTNKSVSMFIYKKTNQVIFEAEDIVIVGRIISGDFPDYEKAIPKKIKTTVELDVEEFSQKLKLASIFARDSANVVRIIVEDEKMRLLTSSQGLGEGEAVLDVKKDGEDNEIAFNIKFLTDLIRNIQAKEMIIEFSSPVEPAIFKTSDDPAFTHIIMPVRLQE